ncbi:uncharacterized protein LOC129585221 isoform X2 [Paramacrobiotus metropolitanus]|uniref:uncharacterized protein LOC129585221 isoform X2 n=1 Tax=Paramacrobiotus metropolitanus TaxID=2943436 RepID=UPI0024465646|nr:uncharacterized protein LOC129585221 isoform X2 [Paramacrobiotus metropolitanus]
MHNGTVSLSSNPPTMVLPPSLLGQQPPQDTSSAGGTGSSSQSDSAVADVHCVVCQQSLFVKDMTPPRQQKPWKCNGCQQWFTVKSSAKRHVVNVHKDRVCRDCGERGMGGEGVASGGKGAGTTGGMNDMMHMHQQVVPEPSQPTFMSNRSASMIADPTEHQQKVYIQASQPTHIQIQPTAQHPAGTTLTIHDTHDLQADLALLSLMLANNLDLKTMDAIIMLLNSGRDFSKIKNAAHWLERLGRGAAVNVATHCNVCKRPATQACLNSGHQTHSAPVLAAHPVVKMPQMQNSVASVASVPSLSPFPGGTVIGIFDASGQLLPTNSIPMAATSVVTGSQAPQPVAQAQATPKKAKSRKKRPAAANAPNGPPREIPATPTTPHTGNKVGSLATSWKAIARNNLYSLHTPQELLGLCVVGRRVDKTVDTGLQPMDTEKRRVIAEAVANHCNNVGIPIPSETQINHFMSQILCDLRRKESLQATGQTPTRKKIKKEEAAAAAATTPSSTPTTSSTTPAGITMVEPQPPPSLSIKHESMSLLP